MSPAHPISRSFTIDVTPALRPLVSTALLLEKLERAPRNASADQYRAVAQRLCTLLVETPPGAGLDQVLAAFPATAEVYENLNYASAGLCRAPLEPALNAELDASAAIRRAQKQR